MEGMNIGFFINIRKEVDCKDNRFKNEESYVRERRDTNNPAFSSFIHLLFVSRLSPRSLLPEGRVTVCLATRSIRLPSLRSETGPLRGVRRGERMVSEETGR